MAKLRNIPVGLLILLAAVYVGGPVTFAMASVHAETAPAAMDHEAMAGEDAPCEDACCGEHADMACAGACAAACGATAAALPVPLLLPIVPEATAPESSAATRGVAHAPRAPSRPPRR